MDKALSALGLIVFGISCIAVYFWSTVAPYCCLNQCCVTINAFDCLFGNIAWISLFSGMIITCMGFFINIEKAS